MKARPHDVEPFMDPPDYGQSLTGLTLNLLSTNLDRARTFHSEVLGVSIRYIDADLLIAEGAGTSWMVHADHTYDNHRLMPLAQAAQPRGAGLEIRLHGLDPDEAAAAAHHHGFTVFDGPRDQPDHGLREAHIQDADGYMWVPDVPLVS
jgi:predicted enzyme related to lactoylglutathione lyase